MASKHDEKFGRGCRLLKEDEYKSVLAKGAGSDRVTIQPFIFYARNSTHKTARLGLAVASRFLKKAVQRNRVKRMIRESFRKNKHRLPARDYVVIYKDNAPPSIPRCREVLESFWDAQASGEAK